MNKSPPDNILPAIQQACISAPVDALSGLQLPTQDEVEFWHKAEKSGWLQSQGEHLRTWRRRWFVLKQGFLFRFADQNVVASSKPRGIVDLSKVTDVSSGREATGKNNSITLSTEAGSVRPWHIFCVYCVRMHGLFHINDSLKAKLD